MEFDSIKHLGVNPDLFDVDKCHEDYVQGTFNHIIVLKLIKQSNVCCPHCGLVNCNNSSYLKFYMKKITLNIK